MEVTNLQWILSVVGKDEQYLMAKYSAEDVAGTFECVMKKRDQGLSLIHI